MDPDCIFSMFNCFYYNFLSACFCLVFGVDLSLLLLLLIVAGVSVCLRKKAIDANRTYSEQQQKKLTKFMVTLAMLDMSSLRLLLEVLFAVFV